MVEGEVAGDDSAAAGKLVVGQFPAPDATAASVKEAAATKEERAKTLARIDERLARLDPRKAHS